MRLKIKHLLVTGICIVTAALSFRAGSIYRGLMTQETSIVTSRHGLEDNPLTIVHSTVPFSSKHAHIQTDSSITMASDQPHRQGHEGTSVSQPTLVSVSEERQEMNVHAKRDTEIQEMPNRFLVWYNSSRRREEKSTFGTHEVKGDTAISKHKPSSPETSQVTDSNNSHMDPTKGYASHNCKRSHCEDYLSAVDQAHYRECLNHAKSFHLTSQDGNCRFIDGSHRHPVALVSYPGSGNTWVRGLLETATGICTGAIYCDMSLRAHGMIGENVQSGSVLVVKTHGSIPRWINGRFKNATHGGKTYFGSAIFIIRNPLDALVAEWNRKVANNFRGRTVIIDSHTKHAGELWFGTNKKWQSFVHDQSKRWQTMVRNWVLKSGIRQRVLVVKFEDVKRNATSEVLKMLEFLQIPHTDSDVRERLSNDFASFQRRQQQESFDHYTAELRTLVLNSVKTINIELHNSRISQSITLDEYLKT